MPDIRAKCRQYRWTLQQDGPLSDTAKNTNYLKTENVSFIKPQMCALNSPDLNPIDYAIWGALQQQVLGHYSDGRYSNN